MRVRACIKCRQYISIQTNSTINDRKLEEFEKIHKNHSLISVDLTEVKGTYENVEGELDHILSQKNPNLVFSRKELRNELKKCKLIKIKKRSFKEAFGFEMDEARTPLMRLFEESPETHPGTYAIYENNITNNYIEWLEKKLVSQVLLDDGM
jgi:hypothetical protein